MGQPQERNGWNGRKVESMTDVVEALEYLNLPKLPGESLRVIAQSEERGRFKRALQDCVAGGSVSPETKRYLTGLVRCMSTVAMQAVESLGFKGVTPEAMLHIGKSNGMAFRNALDAAANFKDPNSANGLSLVASSIREAFDHLNIPFNPAAVSASSRAVAAPSRQEPHPDASGDEAGAVMPTSDPESEEAGRSGAKGEYLSTHVYGGKAALCFNASKSKGEKHHTVVVDGGPAIGQRKYDWSNGVSIQLGHKELPLLFGVLMGWGNEVKFDAHGPANDKTFEIQRQDGKFFAKVMGKVNKNSVAFAVPIGPADALPLMEITFAQIVKEAPKELQGSPDLIYKMMHAAQTIKPIGGH